MPWLYDPLLKLQPIEIDYGRPGEALPEPTDEDGWNRLWLDLGFMGPVVFAGNPWVCWLRAPDGEPWSVEIRGSDQPLHVRFVLRHILLPGVWHDILLEDFRAFVDAQLYLGQLTYFSNHFPRLCHAVEALRGGSDGPKIIRAMPGPMRRPPQ